MTVEAIHAVSCQSNGGFCSFIPLRACSEPQSPRFDVVEVVWMWPGWRSLQTRTASERLGSPHLSFHFFEMKMKCTDMRAWPPICLSGLLIVNFFHPYKLPHSEYCLQSSTFLMLRQIVFCQLNFIELYYTEYTHSTDGKNILGSE